MTLPPFAFERPASVDELCAILAEKGDDARLMAGGTDLLLKLEAGAVKAGTVIGLRQIDELQSIEFSPSDGLSFGAATTLSELLEHSALTEHYPAMVDAARETATVQIRNMGTAIGNICNASPSADNIPVLVALDAVATLVSSKEERQVSLGDFFIGPGKTTRRSDEVMTRIHVPAPQPGYGSSYQYVSARSLVDIKAACVGVALQMKGDTCQKVRIVLGGVAPTPMRAVDAEAEVAGKQLTEACIEAAGAAASAECRPIDDVRASAYYRRRMIAVLTRRALGEALQRAGIN